MRMQVQSLASFSGLRIWHCRELLCRLQTRLRSGVAVAVVYLAVALIGPLAWEPPYAMGGALKKQTKKKQKHPTKSSNQEEILCNTVLLFILSEDSLLYTTLHRWTSKFRYNPLLSGLYLSEPHQLKVYLFLRDTFPLFFFFAKVFIVLFHARQISLRGKDNNDWCLRGTLFGCALRIQLDVFIKYCAQ